MAINEELLYEVNEEGERVVVKSIESTQRAFLRFTNRTNRPVDIWWRDFQGIRRHYVELAPNSTYDVNSYLTHPWEFTDVNTKEQYRINNKTIFRAPENIGDMEYRTNWNITIGMRTLRHTALLAVAMRLSYPDLVFELDLPLTVEDLLHELMEKLNKTEPEPSQ